MPNLQDSEDNSVIREVLSQAKTIAVVGHSDKQISASLCALLREPLRFKILSVPHLIENHYISRIKYIKNNILIKDSQNDCKKL
jgi:predicted CoA-binding protein